jgi:hypothetical protein
MKFLFILPKQYYEETKLQKNKVSRYVILIFSSLLTYEGTYASVKSLLSRDYMHHVDLSDTRKSPKGYGLLGLSSRVMTILLSFLPYTRHFEAN